MRMKIGITALLACALSTNCAENEVTRPKVPTSVAKTANVPFNQFFIAWDELWNYRSSPIVSQARLDTRQYRQYHNRFDTLYQDVLDFAAANPGKLYIFGDEPDTYHTELTPPRCVSPTEYAGMYRSFVTAILAVDPTADFSPGGFSEPHFDEHCPSAPHSIDYAAEFYDAYVQQYGVPPLVMEWRFHDFGLSIPVSTVLLDTTTVSTWWSRVSNAAAWSVAHGALMVVGGWGFIGDASNDTTVSKERIKQAMGRLMNDSRIVQAAYWSLDDRSNLHYLTYPDSTLTPEGRTYTNPLTDIPASVTVGGASQGRALIQWTNTTSAWAAEAEFWVQVGGVGSYVYSNTAHVPGPGGTLTPYSQFNVGDRVKGRVRYYNAYGQAAWSPLSNPTLLH